MCARNYNRTRIDVLERHNLLRQRSRNSAVFEQRRMVFRKHHRNCPLSLLTTRKYPQFPWLPSIFWTSYLHLSMNKLCLKDISHYCFSFLLSNSKSAWSICPEKMFCLKFRKIFSQNSQKMNPSRLAGRVIYLFNLRRQRSLTDPVPTQ